MTDRVFVDSNVWVYIFARDEAEKCEIAKQFIGSTVERSTAVISYQVINEVTNVLKRKRFTESAIRQVIASLTEICFIQNNSKEIALSASVLREKFSLSFWDSQIIASALAAQCNIVASEDMQHSQVIDGLTISNIFNEQ